MARFARRIRLAAPERGMTIVLIAHSAVETVNDPRAPSLYQYQLRAPQARACAAPGLGRRRRLPGYDFAIKSEDVGFGRKRVRADGGSQRYLHFERGRPSPPRTATACRPRCRCRSTSTSPPSWHRFSRRLRRKERFPCAQLEDSSMTENFETLLPEIFDPATQEGNDDHGASRHLRRPGHRGLRRATAVGRWLLYRAHLADHRGRA